MMMLFNCVLLILVGCLVNVTMQIGSCGIPSNATTANIDDIVLGRCYYYLNILNSKDCDIQQSNINCTAIWNEFKSVVLSKNPCDITISSYDRLLQLTSYTIEPNSTMFWSGTYSPAHEISKTSDYSILEDTLTGYLFNELTFCSAAGQNYFSNVSCPRDCVSSNNPFWNAASINFARKASGSALVVLNGTRTVGALLNTSTFYRHELPQLSSNNVKMLKVLLLHDPGKAKYETCDKPVTLNTLKALLAEKSIEYQCEDNPDNIIFLMCFQNPLSRECQAIKYSINSASSPHSLVSSFFSLAYSCLVFILFRRFF